jgi:hypothetical protein
MVPLLVERAYQLHSPQIQIRTHRSPPMRFQITSWFTLPLKYQRPPFIPLPVELIWYILQFAASEDFNTGLSLCLVSSDVRRQIHPIIYETVEIFGLRRMTDFAAIFANQSLLATSVRNLTLYDDTPGDWIRNSQPLDHLLFPKILGLCRGIRRLAINYIRGIPPVDGPQPFELTIRRCPLITLLGLSLHTTHAFTEEPVALPLSHRLLSM